MSLASLLLHHASESSKAEVDKDLDSLFQSNPAPPQPTVPIAIPSDNRGQKRKRERELQTPHSKSDNWPQKAAAKRVKGGEIPKKEQLAKKKIIETSENIRSSDAEEEDEDDSELEQQYFARKVSTSKKVSARSSEPESSSNEHSEDSVPPPVHEIHAKSQKRSKNRNKVRYVPPDETAAQRDARTIFVGNVAIAVLTSKSAKNQLKSHFLDLVPEGTIESMRFRSVAFLGPTAKMEESVTPSVKQQRQIERAAGWRDSQGAGVKTKNNKSAHAEDDASDVDTPSKKSTHAALTPAARKRIAFIKQEFHREVDTVNAYIVFAHDPPVDTKQGSKDTTNTPLHPAEAARLAVERGDGTAFMEHTIRVDRVGQWRAGLPEELAADAEQKIHPRTTVFVGNLDFAAKDEELRIWFEGVISKERGPPPNESDDGSDIESGREDKRRKRWVKNVRIIRDKDTQLGKGFAYVKFSDRECVDELLHGDMAQLVFAKRRLRIQRCKGMPGATPKSSAAVKPQKARQAPVVVPKGDPNMGAQLAGLSKDERKAVKAANLARVERRLAKKKAGAAVKLNKTSAGRDRERRRKGDKGKKGKPKPKGKMRSEKAVEKRNAKK